MSLVLVLFVWVFHTSLPVWTVVLLCFWLFSQAVCWFFVTELIWPSPSLCYVALCPWVTSRVDKHNHNHTPRQVMMLPLFKIFSVKPTETLSLLSFDSPTQKQQKQAYLETKKNTHSDCVMACNKVHLIHFCMRRLQPKCCDCCFPLFMTLSCRSVF